MALADALGNLVDFRLLPGQAHDLRGTAVLIEGLTCGQFLADRAFDAIVGGVSYRVIPWQMGVVAKLLRLLPNAWFDRALAGRARKHRQGGGKSDA